MYADSGPDPLPDDQVCLVVEVFRMLADATRVQVLWSLADREMSVNELAEQVGKMARSTAKVLQCGVNTLLRCGHENRQDAVDDALTTIAKGTGDRVHRTDHRESTEHLVVD